MLIRTACVLLAVVTSGPIQWLAIFGAVFLPYFAVVSANNANVTHSPQRPMEPVASITEPPKN